MAFKTPDITGPRFRKKFHMILAKRLHLRFIEAHPQHSSVTWEKFRDVIKGHSQKMWETTINERDGIELPIVRGSIFLGSTKIKVKNNYDIQASIKANDFIRHRNYDTDGHVAKIYYSPYLSKIGGRDRSLWSFKGVREYKRSVSKAYAKNWKNYQRVTSLDPIVDEYHRHERRIRLTEKTAYHTKSYNEFDLN